MRLLLDTHIFLWFDDPAKVPPSVRAMLDDEKNDLYLSLASVWESSLKRTIGKLHFSGPVVPPAEAYRIGLIPVRAEHVEAIESLPRKRTDLFDHLVLAQARVENSVLVTHDEVLARYGVPVWLV